MTSATSPLLRAGRGLLDLLTGPHGVDRYAELVDPRYARDRHVVTVRHVVRETPDTVTLHLDAPRGWTTGALAAPDAGQAVSLTVEVDGVRHRRSFTVASRHDAAFTVTVRANPDGTVSRHLVEHAVAGLQVEVGPAYGEMVLPDDRGRARGLLLVSGGSGITPVMAMLRQLRAENLLALAPGDARDLPRIGFLHYARTPDELIFADELARLTDAHHNLDLVVVHTGDDAPVGPHGLHGRFAPSHLDALGVDPTVAHVYACGPSGLVDAVAESVDQARLTVEVFHPPAAPTTDGDTPEGTVTLTTSGMSIEAQARSLLEQAEAAGLSPEHGCRMGICHTCTTPVTAGSVRDLLTGEIRTATDSAPLETQICISSAHGDCSVEL